ncbi:MAG: CaiB/BaiF CoA-transferase family protein [Thermodesulfobacteriota bacterium]|nr:CaiB/BaiF CoA-transferase family protein [Thermodesulfobacteriota bacterium]
MASALEGIKILDVSRLLPFNYCTMMLADLGAEVLKVEEPGMGDYMRWLPPKLKKENAIFLMANRNKRSMTLNFREEKGKEILRQLAKENDVLFESFRPGVMNKLGVGYENLKEVNPKLVFCSSTGYGQTGPYKDRPGHDMNYISVAGILEATGRHTGAPVIPGIPVADMSIGIFSAFSILAGIMARDRTGKGQHIDVSMTDCMVSYNMMNIADFVVGQQSQDAEKFGITGETPCYNVFKTKDGKFISLGNIEGKFWKNTLKLINREDLDKFQFATGEEGEKAMEELQKVFLSKTRKEWLDIFEGQDICYAPINSAEDVVADPQVRQREMIFEMEHPVEGTITTVGFPFKFSETPGNVRMPSPTLGQHTEEVLKGLGYNDSDIQEMKEKGVI